MASDLISRTELLKCFSVTKDGRRIPERDCDNFEVTVSIRNIKRIIKEQPTAYDVEKAIYEIETKVYKDAVCVGCGYLKDNICTYKGSACGVSKPMLENIKRVFENIRKGGVNE